MKLTYLGFISANLRVPWAPNELLGGLMLFSIGLSALLESSKAERFAISLSLLVLSTGLMYIGCVKRKRNIEKCLSYQLSTAIATKFPLNEVVICEINHKNGIVRTGRFLALKKGDFVRGLLIRDGEILHVYHIN